MLTRLRIQLTLLYLFVAMSLVALTGVGSYSLIKYFFVRETDLALQYKMATQFRLGRIVTTVFVPVVSSVITALIVILQGNIVVHLALVKSVLAKTGALLFPDFALGCANPTFWSRWRCKDVLVFRSTSPQQRGN